MTQTFLLLTSNPSDDDVGDSCSGLQTFFFNYAPPNYLIFYL